MIRPLQSADTEAFRKMRQEALISSPLSFGASADDDRASKAEDLQQLIGGVPGAVILGAFDDDGALLGVSGCYRDPSKKTNHKAHVWGMYVAPGQRGKGLAGQLLDAAIAHARGLDGIDYVQLCVSTTAPDAQHVYERAGFRIWGTEPAALRHDGQEAGEHHMILDLRTL